MKKSKLVVGILLMILGIGVSIGSVVLRHHENGRYGMMNPGHKMVNRHGMMGGSGYGGFKNRPFNVRPNQNQGQNPNTKPLPTPPTITPAPVPAPNVNATPTPQPNQNQNNGQNSNGGTKQ